MQLLNDNEKEKGFQFFKKFTDPSSRRGFIADLKYAFNENKFIKTLSIVGFGAAAIKALTLNIVTIFGLLSLIQLLGQVAGGYAINNAIRGSTPMQLKSNSDVNVHILKSVGVGGIGLIATALFSILPFSGLFTYFTSMLIIAGLGGIFEGGIEKYRRPH